MGELIDSYNFCAKNTEEFFNVLNCMPFGIPIITGQLQALAGRLQSVGATFALFGAALYGVCLLADWHPRFCHTFKELMVFGAEQFVHGTLNIFQGNLAAHISWWTLSVVPILGFGNLALWAFQQAKPEPFAPIFSYGSFTGRHADHIRI